MMYRYETIATRIGHILGKQVSFTPYEHCFQIVMLNADESIDSIEIKKPEYINHWSEADLRIYVLDEMKNSYPEYFL